MQSVLHDLIMKVAFLYKVTQTVKMSLAIKKEIQVFVTLSLVRYVKTPVPQFGNTGKIL